MMRRRRWWFAGGAIAAVAAVIAVLCLVFLTDRPTSDCASVRSMIDYNKQFNDSVESSTEKGTQPSVAACQDWASQLSHLAGQVHDPTLAQQAGTVAALAGQTVTIVQRFRADASDAAGPDAQDYGRIGKEFNPNLVALNQACAA